MDRKHIEQWLHEGTINESQAKKMLADVVAHGKEHSSARFIMAVATIGAVLLGIGATLFIASQWDELANPLKVLLLLGVTASAYGAGYWLHQKRYNFPMVGNALIFLGALLFGATVFLTNQMYQVNIGLPGIFFLWFLGTIPSVYTFNSAPIACLDAVLFYLCLTYLFFGVLSEGYRNLGDWFALPIFLIVSGLLLFEGGGLHYLAYGWKAVARAYRLVGVNIVMLALFFLTFRYGLEIYAINNVLGGADISKPLAGWLLVCAIGVVAFKLVYIYKTPRQWRRLWEHVVEVTLLSVSLFYFFVPPTLVYEGMPSFTSTLAFGGPPAQFWYALLFNVLACAMIIFMFWIGYRREDMPLVNTATVWAFILIVARYVDVFWNVFDRTAFFLIGGILFLVLAILVERRRRELSVQFYLLRSS